MSPSNIRAAIREAQRFIATAADLLERNQKDERQEQRTYPLAGSKASGAARRASLDLTRALAEMRKP